MLPRGRSSYKVCMRPHTPSDASQSQQGIEASASGERPATWCRSAAPSGMIRRCFLCSLKPAPEGCGIVLDRRRPCVLRGCPKNLHRSPKTLGCCPRNLRYGPRNPRRGPKTPRRSPKTPRRGPRNLGCCPKTLWFGPRNLRFGPRTLRLGPRNQGDCPRNAELGPISSRICPTDSELGPIFLRNVRGIKALVREIRPFVRFLQAAAMPSPP